MMPWYMRKNEMEKNQYLRFFCDESGCPYEKIDDPEHAALVEEIATKIAAKTLEEIEKGERLDGKI